MKDEEVPYPSLMKKRCDLSDGQTLDVICLVYLYVYIQTYTRTY